ncbi:hypothetical protein EDM80_07235 [bacterium]|nr:MAG: hypothetical protein EDM80_07235 [bacterium]RIK65412.1 MAG: hypothetical protein DCC64_01890 [Planctomycetota bacterium]
MGPQLLQLGANLGIGELQFSRAFSPTPTAPRLTVKVPPTPNVAAWLLMLKAWPTPVPPGAPVFAFVLVNALDPKAALSILRSGSGAPPGGGSPLAPGESDVFVVSADRDTITVDARFVDATLAAEAVGFLEIEVHALYATPQCPAPLNPDCNKPPAQREKC